MAALTVATVLGPVIFFKAIAAALTWLWQGYVAHRDDIVPLASFFIQLATFIGAAFVAWAAWRQARAAWKQAETASSRHREQTNADRERRITESFAKAIEQLGNAKLEIRLGGIYSLERIARESEREYWLIMETLTAYVRERAPWSPRQVLADPSAQLQSGIADESLAEVLGLNPRNLFTNSGRRQTSPPYSPCS